MEDTDFLYEMPDAKALLRHLLELSCLNGFSVCLLGTHKWNLREPAFCEEIDPKIKFLLNSLEWYLAVYKNIPAS